MAVNASSDKTSADAQAATTATATTATTTATAKTPAPHPLEPLTAAEMRTAVTVLREHAELSAAFRFVSVELAEPPKASVVSREGRDGLPPLDRQAFCVLYERGARRTYEAVVSLTATTVVSFEPVPGVQPSLMLDELTACEQVVLADPRWQAAMRRRGVSDFSLAMVDLWAAGYTGVEDSPGERRIVRPLTFVRAAPGENGYARPVEGLIVVVDLDSGTVVEVTDHGGGDEGGGDAVVALPPRPGNYAPALLTTDPDNVPAFDRLRDDLRPIEIVQPDGPSLTVDGHAVSWQKWSFRIGYTPREGLVLHQLAYLDRGRRRTIVHRASLSEMFIPYGDPAPTHRIKNVFEVVEAFPDLRSEVI